MRHRGAAVGALLLAFVLAACGGGDGTPAATNVENRPAGPETPAGFTVRHVRDQGFSVALPKDWRSLDAHAALNSARAKEFGKANPALGQQLEALTRPNSPIKLLAVDPSTKAGFLTNLNVLITRIPSEISFERWTSAQVSEIKGVPTVSQLRQEETRLEPGRTLHLTYRARFNRPSGSFVASIHQYMVKNDGFLYILTFTTLPKLEGDYRELFDSAARSFRLTG